MTIPSSTFFRFKRIGFLGVAGVLSLFGGSAAFSETGEVMGVETTLRGTTEGIVSHRFQKHSWITPDGGFHALINNGAARNALQFSSSADGVAWTLQALIPDTDQSSHPDGVLAGGRLYIVYPTRAKKVVLAIYDYRSGSKSWQFVKSIAVPAESRTAYERPSVARDGAGRIWISATAVRGKEKFLALFVLEGEAAPRKVDLSFGRKNRYYQRSARLLQIPGGLMMVFSDDPAKDDEEYTLNFCQRLDSLSVDGPWTAAQQILHYRNEPDDNGAHFSCAVDGSGAVHIVTRSFQTMYYLKIAGESLASGTPRDLGVAGPQQYPQASVSGSDSVHLFCPVEEGGDEVVHVLSSHDGGENFNNDCDLVFRSGERMGDRRVEAPARFASALPVLMLYEPSKRDKRLAGFLYEPEGAPRSGTGEGN